MMAKKIPVYTSLYFPSQNSQPLFPHFVPGDALSTFHGDGAVPPLTIPSNSWYCVTDIKTGAWGDQLTQGSHILTLGSASPLPPENTKVRMRSYMCLSGSVLHESVVSDVLFLVEADLM